MSELPKAYESKNVEERLSKLWEERGYFKADPKSSKKPYSIVMPPPNVTGVLHMGHALTTTLQDILSRWKRMSGYEVLWIPGTDHAGIATQTVVERNLMQTTGKRRADFSREEFLKEVWAWKDKSEGQIIQQIKRLGSSCDWSRLRFTMDDGSNHAVRTMFKKLYDAGLIYQGDYLVNWDPVTQTALADDEVEYEDRQSFLWHIKYPLTDGSGFAIVATTRPETMLGDTAVAVSPKDDRYKSMIGKTIRLPLTGREIPILADAFVDPTFGTGMVKITPAHDPNDYQMGQRHNLPFITIMTPDGKINAEGGVYEGLTMAEARQVVVKDLEKQGLLLKAEPHVNRVGVSYRSKAVIEPYISKQWFISMKGFSKQLRAAVESERTRFIPKHWESTYYHWIDNLRDWCISRQLWWGHRIPIWTRKDNPEIRICYEGDDLPPEVQKEPDQWEQDNDVLDTWFSSALWPFSTMGWPENTNVLQKFYPTSVLVTGHDILFFWVARMLMMGEYALNKLPFPDVFLHGLIYGKSYWRERKEGGIAYCTAEERHDFDLGKPVPKDVHSRWEKMSKTKGNVIDPMEISDTYGTDAMRMALCASVTHARQIDLDRRRFEEYKNFANKVWNGARFVLMNLEGLTAEDFSQGLDEKLLSLEDRWILSALGRTVRNVNKHLDTYTFDQSATEAYDFFWREFCAYYVEISKPVLMSKKGTPAERQNKQKLLVIVLCQAIRLMHPMAPFITEELFQIIRERLQGIRSTAATDPYTAETVSALLCDACAIAPYPQLLRESDLNPEIDATFSLVEKTVYTIRNIRGEMKVPPGTHTDVHITGVNGDPNIQILKDNLGIVQALVRVGALEVHATEPELGFAATGVVDTLKIAIPLPAEMLANEKTRLGKEQERLTLSLEKINKQLDNQEFVAKAPAALLEKQRELREQTERELESVHSKLNQL